MRYLHKLLAAITAMALVGSCIVASATQAAIPTIPGEGDGNSGTSTTSSCGGVDEVLYPKRLFYYFSNIMKKNGNTVYGKKPTSTQKNNIEYIVHYLPNEKAGLVPGTPEYKNPLAGTPSYDKSNIAVTSTTNGNMVIQPKSDGSANVYYTVVNKAGDHCKQSKVVGFAEGVELPNVAVYDIGIYIHNMGAYGRKRDDRGNIINKGNTTDLWVTFKSLRSGKTLSATVEAPNGSGYYGLPSKLLKEFKKYGYLEWQASPYPPGYTSSLLSTRNNSPWYTVRYKSKGVSVDGIRSYVEKVSLDSAKPTVAASVKVKKRTTATVRLRNKTAKTVRYQVTYKKKGAKRYRTITRMVKAKKSRTITLRKLAKGSKVVVKAKATTKYKTLVRKKVS